uniref:NAD-dependent epimerase/dehydratase domain-containing protein n=1 Tax=Bionectria ochroleuca TaxID=29856 RepID=A0A8H7N2J7_BIOOC
MPAVPPNGLILLTGANGYIASVTAKVLIDRGYKVRGTVRSISNFSWMPSYYGPNFTLAEVPDFAADGAFNEAVKGVDGIIHMGANVTLQPDPTIVDAAIQSVNQLLEAASKEPSVKRVVLTSARAACINEIPGTPYRITKDMWNDEAIEELKKPADAHSPQVRGMLVYGAAKCLAERGAWEFVRKNKPHFIFNSVLPNVNFGKVEAIEYLGFKGSGCFVNALDKGIPFGPVLIPHQLYVNVQDTALLHLGALTLEDVQNERLMAMAGTFSWNEIIGILRRRFPERKNMVVPGEEKTLDIGEVDNGRAADVLRQMGRDGFRSLEDTLVENMECVIAADSLKVARNGTDDVIDMIFKGAGQP